MHEAGEDCRGVVHRVTAGLLDTAKGWDGLLCVPHCGEARSMPELIQGWRGLLCAGRCCQLDSVRRGGLPSTAPEPTKHP